MTCNWNLPNNSNNNNINYYSDNNSHDTTDNSRNLRRGGSLANVVRERITLCIVTAVTIKKEAPREKMVISEPDDTVLSGKILMKSSTNMRCKELKAENRGR